jgi:ribosomal protein L11 methyltransferase
MAVTYLEISVILKPVEPWRPVMIDQMGALGFESFVDTSKGFKAYIPEEDFREIDFLQLDVFDLKGIEIDWQSKTIAPQNWNHQWEQNFLPIRVGERCVVRAHFHLPEKAEYELVITPKMSFGTGHHETTQLMISFLLELDCWGKKVLDMGTGTGVLAILAEKKGAQNVLAVDNDPWCVENTQENLGLNDCQKISAELNSRVPRFDLCELVLANINRNVLLKQIKDYAKILKADGDLLMSGFYTDDLSIIVKECESSGFRFIRKFEKNRWVAAHFVKSE